MCSRVLGDSELFGMYIKAVGYDLFITVVGTGPVALCLFLGCFVPHCQSSASVHMSFSHMLVFLCTNFSHLFCLASV